MVSRQVNQNKKKETLIKNFVRLTSLNFYTTSQPDLFKT